jgi:serine/threonine protein kinase
MVAMQKSLNAGNAAITFFPAEDRFTMSPDKKQRSGSIAIPRSFQTIYLADPLAVALKFLPKATCRRFRPMRAAVCRGAHRPASVASQYLPRLRRELEGRHFLTMEYIDGEDLALLLKRIGSLHGSKVPYEARQLCAGLAAAHDKGVLHRDLKLANVMIDGPGHVRITDFGLAVAAGEAIPEADVSGTPPHMAPEQFAGKGASVRSDIYALGLVVCEVFAGGTRKQRGLELSVDK